MNGFIQKIITSGLISRRNSSVKNGKWRVPILILLCLLLPVLAWMQYYYLGKLSEVEKQRLKSNLELSAKKFSEDFDDELTKIRQEFLFDEDSSVAFETRLLQSYREWKQSASFPDLVKDIYLLEFYNGAPVLSFFSNEKGNFSICDWPEELGLIKQNLPEPLPAAGPLIMSFTQAPLLSRPPLILLECLNCRLKRNKLDNPLIMNFDYLIIILRADVITNRLIPRLISRYLPPQGEVQFNIAIAQQNSPNEVFFVSDSELGIQDFNHAEARTEIGRWRDQDLMIVKTGIIAPKADIMKLRENMQKDKDLPDESRLYKFKIDNTAKWELIVKYRHGTLEGMVNKARNRNLFISYCILLLLGISMAMVYISSQRADALARRQLRFVSGVSHELRTPISVIRSAGENLADGIISDTDQQKKYGRLIRDEGRRLTTMVENILTFSALQGDKARMNIKAIRINDLLEECINDEAGSNNAANPNITIETDHSSTLVAADPESLKTAFRNIIENSLKYSSKSLLVLISIRQQSESKMLEIRFEDSGRGIDHEDLPHIFEPFYRGKNNNQDRTPGSGLGLSLVKDIINRHGGRIEVKSQRYIGTAVSIFLPIKAYGNKR